MNRPEPFVRDAGAGPAVVCLHSNASTSGQWRALIDALAPRHRVLATDAYGAGRSPPWPTDRPARLAEEVALIQPVLDRIDGRFVLVGHSYGGAVALLAALANPGRVSGLALYEPTLFSLIDAVADPPNAADGIRAAVAEARVAADAGDPGRAAGHFIDYWMGEGSWAAMPPARKPAIQASVANLDRWAQALFSEPTALAAFAALDVPVLYMLGARSTAAAHGVAHCLLPVLPRVERVVFDALGHMAPVTHPGPVNAAIAAFVDRVA